MKIILDTNFLVYCAENKVDYATGLMEILAEGYELVVPSQVIVELKEIKEEAKKYSDRRAADLALKLLKFNKVKIVKTKGEYADDAILSISDGNIIASLDKRLKLKAEGRAVGGVVVSRDKKLMIE